MSASFPEMGEEVDPCGDGEVAQALPTAPPLSPAAARAREEAEVRSMTESKRLWKRAKGGVAVARAFGKVSDDVKVFGTAHVEKQADACEEGAEGAAGACGGEPHDPASSKPWYVIHPASTFHTAWDFLVVLLLMYVALVLPLRLAFDAFPGVQWDDPEFVAEFAMDLLFVADIVINFLTAFWRGDELVTQPREIARNYVRGWFAVDLVSSLPLYLVDSSYRLTRLARLPRLLRLLKMLRLLQLLRLVRLNRYVDRVQFARQINTGFVRIFNFCFWFVLIVHFMSSVWVLLGNARDDPEDTWRGRADAVDEGNWGLYLTAVYWTLSTTLTVGYGDVVATNEAEYGFSIAAMLLGVTFYSFIISNVSNILTTVYAGQSENEARAMAVRRFAVEAELPPALRTRVLAHFRYTSDAEARGLMSAQQREEVLGALSTGLRSDVVLWTHRETVRKVPLLAKADTGFAVAVLRGSTPLRVGPGEFVQHEEVHSSDIFFLVRGRAEALDSEGRVLHEVVEGSYFGDLEHFLPGSAVDPNVRAATDCHLLALPVGTLRGVLADYEREAKGMRKVAAERWRRLSARVARRASNGTLAVGGGGGTEGGAGGSASDPPEGGALLAQVTAVEAAVTAAAVRQRQTSSALARLEAALDEALASVWVQPVQQ